MKADTLFRQGGSVSIQNIGSSTAALNAQLLQSSNSSGDSSFNSADLPQLSSDQIQQLQQALTQDVQNAFASGASGGDLQSQIDNNVTTTLGKFGFNANQTQTVLDKLNQAAGGQGHAGRAHGGGRGHGRRAQQVIANLIQTLQNSANGQTTNSSDSSNPTNTLLSAITGSPSTSSGQGLDLTA